MYLWKLSLFYSQYLFFKFLIFEFHLFLLLFSFIFFSIRSIFLNILSFFWFHFFFFWEEKESSCSICENNKGAQKAKMNWKIELINRFIIFSDLFCSYPKKKKTIALSFPNPIQIHTLFTFFCFCCCWNFHNKVIIIIIIMITRNKKRLLSRLDKDFRPN